MQEATFKIPDTSLFLRADGALLPEPDPGLPVVDASPALAERLTALYVGRNLRLMSGPGSGSWSGAADAVGASGDAAEGLKHAAEFAEGIVLVGDLIELGIKIAEFMGAFGHPTDPVVTMLERIDARLTQIQDTVLQAWATSRRDMLALLRAHSSSALRTVQEYLEVGSPQNDPVWAAKIALADRDSLLAAQTCVGSGIDGGFWLRPFSWQALGVDPSRVHDSWAAHHPDRDELTRDPAWDYRFALPATAYALTVRAAVLRAVSPDSLMRGKAGCREIKGYVRFLRDVAERMHKGIWALYDIDLKEPNRFQLLFRGRVPVAAADIYTGYGGRHSTIVHASDWLWFRKQDPTVWPSGLVEPHEGVDNDDIIRRARHNVGLVGRHWWGQIWSGIGMKEMCQLISDLDHMCTPPQFPRREIQVAHKLLRGPQDDPRKRIKASIASGLAILTSDYDEIGELTRTFQLYQALDTEGDRAHEIISRATEELLALNRAAEPERPAPLDT